MAKTIAKHDFPRTLAELVKDPEDAFKNDELNFILNQPVPKEWIKKHPLVKVKNEFNNWVPLEYIPVDKVEYLLTRIFQRWTREVKFVGQLFNSVYVIVRLGVRNPVTGEWEYQEGGGAVPVQTDKDASAAELDKIKSNAVQIALPAAISYALKDAAECFGTTFGKNLNKRDTVAFTSGSYFGAATPPAADGSVPAQLTEGAVNLQQPLVKQAQPNYNVIESSTELPI